MNVVVDAHMVGLKETGNETYVLNLLRAYDTMQYDSITACLVPNGSLPRDLCPPRHLQISRLSSANNWLRLLSGLPKVCRQSHADVLHVTYNSPFITPCSVVVTVHDVSFRRYASFFRWRDRLLFATLLHRSLRRATAVITDSQAARSEILHFYPFLSNRVFVIYLAADKHFAPVSDPRALEAVCRRYKVRLPFVLAVGNLQPRKNIMRLVQAYRLICEDMTDPPHLVLVGQPGYRFADFTEFVQDLLSSGRLTIAGYLPTSDLPALYSAASVFVYPSFYEGFGLPVVESMACGTPVITSNVSSLPEAAGDAAILVDPKDVCALAHAIRQVLHNGTLAAELSERGLKRARMLSWEETARQTWGVYKYAANEGHGMGN